MTTITIPKKFIKNDDLVFLPRREYEKLLRGVAGSSQPSDVNLEEAMQEARNGKTIGPFSSIKELESSLEK